MTISEFVAAYVQRGECKCGLCFDAKPNPHLRQPKGHTADMVFFKVKLNPNGNSMDNLESELRRIIQSDYAQYLDGKEHGYMEIGGDVGDQGIALQLMGAGHLLGLWDLITPKTLLPDMPSDFHMSMAGGGLITIQAEEV